MHDPMDEKILTLHPQGKKGVNISRAKYDAMKTTILASSGGNNSLTTNSRAR